MVIKSPPPLTERVGTTVAEGAFPLPLRSGLACFPVGLTLLKTGHATLAAQATTLKQVRDG